MGSRRGDFGRRSLGVTHSPMRVAVSGEAEFNDARLQKKGELAPGQLPRSCVQLFPLVCARFVAE
jgi:hypothetical protein